MDRNAEQILIIYSIAATGDHDLKLVEKAINAFARPGSTARTSALVFRIPTGAAPGATLGSELTDQLRASVGAVVFVDDLRPNVAYELGFFHGQGRPVLLITHGRVDSVWTAISDLAGAALVSLEQQEPTAKQQVLTASVHAYLDRLYSQLGLIAPWPLRELPSAENNLLNSTPSLKGRPEVSEGGPFGSLLRINSWDGMDIPMGMNLIPEAAFKVVVRTATAGSDYSVYFQVLFGDRDGIRRRVWLGLTSSRRTIRLDAGERNLPAERATQQWRVLTASFRDLLHSGLVLGAGRVEHLDRIRIRAGTPDRVGSIEIGFVDIIGVSR